MPPDTSFDDTVAILRGETTLSGVPRELGRWISERYDTEVLNIVIDTIRDGQTRVMVWVRTADQAKDFHSPDGNYDRAKQGEIAEQFAELCMRHEGLIRRIRRRLHPPLPAFVAFHPFEPDARNDLVSMRPAEEEELRQRLGAETIWRILTAFGRVVFFVHTEQEAARMQNGPEFQRWVEEFLDAVRPADEFDVLSRLPPMFELDSRERFERDFQNNTYYYLR